MMILNLNLLSPVKKANNKHVVRFLFIKNMLEISLFVAAIIATALLLSWIVLQEDFNNLSGSAVLVNQGFSTYDQEVHRINQINHNLVAIGQNFRPITNDLLGLVTSTPANIKLASVDLDRPNLKLRLTGTAKGRNDLLEYQEKIKTFPYVEKVDTPSSQLTQKENINFEFTITLKKQTK